MADKLTAISTDQLLKGYGARSFYTIEGIVSKFVQTLDDITNTASDLPLRFIVKNPNTSLTDLGAENNDICVVNDNGTYSFIKPKETTTILFLQGTCIYHFKNNQWNNVLTFSQVSVNGEVPEAPEDGEGYIRVNKIWENIKNHLVIRVDAPLDNGFYARKMGQWSRIYQPPFTDDAPINNKLYGRKNSTWEEVKAEVPEAPEDNSYYARRNKTWEIIPNIGDSVIPEAPNDGVIYGRKNKNWVSVSEGFPDVNNDNTPYVRKDKVWSRLSDNLPINTDSPKNNKIYGRKDGSWEEIIQVAGIEDAPNDGNSYLRKNKSWSIFNNTGISDVPSENPDKLYLRKYNTWVEYIERNVEEAPNDNKEYVRKNKAWVKAKNVPFENDAPQDTKIYGRKDGAWEEITGGGSGGPGGGSNHNLLSGIQGGKSDSGNIIEAYHLTKEEYERVPYKPIIEAPSNNSTNINQIPQISGSAYRHPFDYPMYALEVIISKTPNFDNIVYTFSGYNQNTIYQLPEKENGLPILETATEYWVKIRYQDNRRKWSAYSDPIKFETMIQFPEQILKQPIMINPTNGGRINDKDPILVMTSPSVNIGTANFISADWQISSNQDFSDLLYNKENSTDLSYHATENVNLVATNHSSFYVRGRQKTNDGTYTNWSNPSKCVLNPVYDDLVFGLRRIYDRENEAIRCFHIDRDGNIIKLGFEYLNNHPFYNYNIEERVENPLRPSDKHRIIKITPIYMKHNIYNSYGNKIVDVWFSPINQSESGWYLHPAFVEYPNGFCVSNKAPSLDYDSTGLIVKNIFNNMLNDLGSFDYHYFLDNDRLIILHNIGYKMSNLYIENLLYYLFVFYNLLTIPDYGDYYAYNLNNYLYYTYYKCYFMNGIGYDRTNKKIKINDPNQIFEKNSVNFFSLDNLTISYNLTINGSFSYNTPYRIIDIHEGPLPTYENFDVFLLGIPKEYNIDASVKSPWKIFKLQKNQDIFPSSFYINNTDGLLMPFNTGASILGRLVKPL